METSRPAFPQWKCDKKEEKSEVDSEKAQKCWCLKGKYRNSFHKTIGKLVFMEVGAEGLVAVQVSGCIWKCQQVAMAYHNV